MLHVRHGKGAKDRYVPLPTRTLQLLRQYWTTHRHPLLLFPAEGRNHSDLAQEFLAEMLGTRRATVSVAAIALQSASLIQYNRGQITIIDKEGLETFSCECHVRLKQANTHGNLR